MGLSIIGTLGLVRFYFQSDFLLKAGVACRDDSGCEVREWRLEYEKNFTNIIHFDLGINIPIGLYGASRGGGVMWVIAGAVLGTSVNMVIASIEHSSYIRNHLNPVVKQLIQLGPTYICINGFPDV